MNATTTTEARDATPPTTRGSTLRSTLDFLLRESGEERVREVLDALAPPQRARVESAAANPTAEIPFALLAELLQAADRLLGTGSPRWVEQAGAYAIESLGMQFYAGILRKSTPLEFLTQPVSLFRLYYQPGNMEVVEHGEGRAVLRLVGFDHRNALFCRRQTGGLHRALELAGGREPGVGHVRCAEEGDAFCEWELRWQAPD